MVSSSFRDARLAIVFDIDKYRFQVQAGVSAKTPAALLTRKSGKMSTVIESLFYCHPFVDKQVFVEVCALSEVLQDELIAMFKSKEQHEYYLLMLTNRLVQCDYK